MSLYLGLDSSTQSVSAVVLDADGPSRRVVWEHSLALDDSAGDGFAELMLAAAAALEPGASRDTIAAHLDRARRQSNKRLLLVEVAQAMFVDCRAGDEKALVTHLSGVLAAGDIAPEHRLDNLVAKRRARRYLESATWRARCASSPPAPAP